MAGLGSVTYAITKDLSVVERPLILCLWDIWSHASPVASPLHSCFEGGCLRHIAVFPALYAVSVSTKMISHFYVPVVPIKTVVTSCATVAAKMEEGKPIAIEGVRGVVAWSVNREQRRRESRPLCFPVTFCIPIVARVNSKSGHLESLKVES